LCLVIYCFMAL